ncbi:YgfZ/GcvT domain-containing protein [Alloalcanivorax marinus]|uniref:CAF17-like 4Fe-4S cluster assembly/insertion protein YgfZ n=1 Tax=Alloalcanivorax marinus TaxID=1177169 RepID=UPI00193312B2|nr:folate-binding protein YgfZ [Alloalcanivorax marinus]MBL7251222.1 folate-binding protein YgfZ [Alloalcanivorax marinus]
MNAWQSLIEAQHPRHGGVTTPALATGEHLAVILAEGEEAGDYLQGQLTVDLKAVDEGAHRAAMHLSLKGRGLVSLRIARVDGGYLLLVPNGQVDATIRCLEKYKLRAKVSFQPAPDTVVAQLAGGVDATLERAGLPAPAPGQAASRDGVTVLRYPHSDHALIVAAASLLSSHWQALSEERAVTDGAGARFQDLLAGEGWILPGAEDLFLPQVLNYDVLGGVSFKKGCYTGQEVVARMHFKGKLKQRMALFAYSGPELAAGQSLRNDQGRAVGEVVDSAPGQPSALMLAVVRLDHEGELWVDDTPLGAEPRALPYELPKPKA